MFLDSEETTIALSALSRWLLVGELSLSFNLDPLQSCHSSSTSCRSKEATGPSGAVGGGAKCSAALVQTEGVNKTDCLSVNAARLGDGKHITILD